MCNNKNVINFENQVMNDKEQFKTDKNKLQKDLLFYLEFYKELSGRSPKMKKVVDLEIKKLVEKLKELGK